MLVQFGQKNLIQKALQQPERVKQVLEKVKTDGLLPTIDAVRARLDQPMPLGYCNVGRVVEIGRNAGEEFATGDRVASNGPHAEFVCVPTNLCARVPDAVPDSAAAFTVLGAIALQGIRLLQPTIGEAIVVMGLGPIGLLAVQILIAHGCRVLGIDLETSKCALARQFGAETVDPSKGEDIYSAAERFSRGRGVDAVLISASTQSSEPIHQAATMCRKRGRIVLVGVVGMELSRADFYEKELSFQVSCSYGPGRYDSEYEQKGRDYPIGFVRWTEQRNFEAFLDLLAARKLDMQPLISRHVPFAEAEEAYRGIGDKSALGIVLEYPTPDTVEVGDGRLVELSSRDARSAKDGTPAVVGVIGAGAFTSQVLSPALKQTGVPLKTIASAKGVTGSHLARKFGFERSTTDATTILGDPEITAIIITTRHNTHAEYVIEGIRKGKHVFVEKPLCLTEEELGRITAVYNSASDPFLLVGFNRRFSPHIQKIRELLAGVQQPVAMIMTVNAGALPRDHWTQDPETGGGRIIGEGCHFVDLLRFLANAPIESVDAARMGNSTDNVSATMGFANGSVGTLHYFANGNKAFPKERLEVFCGGRVLQLDNFRELRGYGWPRFKKMNLWRQDKGHAKEAKAFIEAVQQGSPSPIPFDELVEVTKATFDIVEKISSKPKATQV